MIRSDCVYRIVWRAFYHLLGGIAVETIPPVPYALHFEKICVTIHMRACCCFIVISVGGYASEGLL